MMNPLKHIGPATLVTAAFIGPGTITVCSLAGMQFGLELVWVLVVATLATVALQSMVARLGIISGRGLATNIYHSLDPSIWRGILLMGVFFAIVVGNLAYEAGNISGALIGLDQLGASRLVIGNLRWGALIVGGLAFWILWQGKIKLIESFLVGLVMAMSGIFVLSAILVGPSATVLLQAAFSPSISEGNLLMIASLIGTTIVPYNLFLHAALATKTWKSPEDVPRARMDSWISIGIGGVISLCILIVASAARDHAVSGTEQLVGGLVAAIGPSGRWVIGVGILCAGLSSAITAALAAAIVAQECFGWEQDSSAWRYRAVWMTVLLAGMVFSMIGFSPIRLIALAQVANSIVLPTIVGLILWMVNRRQILGTYKNKWTDNVIGVAVWLFTLFLGVKSLARILGWM